MASEPKKKKNRGGRPRHGVVALSSAAVLAVYSAGFMRTREAARRFDQQDAARAHAVAMALVPSDPAPAVSSQPASSLTADEGQPQPQPDTDAVSPAPSDSAVDTPAATPTAGDASASTPVSPAPVPVTPSASPSVADSSVGSLNVAGSESTPATSSPAPAATTSTAAAPAPVTAAAAASPAPAASQYKDGTYTGWGSCRHGDIQAQVIVADGRITSATIISCLTRYSCSWIAALPGQVVSRQSANVDYVTGATQSSDAFYYAIVQALSKAK